MIILSIDDHTVEPPDLYEHHVPEKYREHAPRLVRDDNGKDHWIFEGKDVATVGLNATVGWPKEDWGMDASSIAEMRPGVYLVDERIRDMDRNGVLASMCFPSMPGFSGGRFYDATDKDLALVMLKAYNDWHVDEWCGSHPGRFIPLAIGPAWDMDATVAEVKRVALGVRALSMPEPPTSSGCPPTRASTGSRCGGGQRRGCRSRLHIAGLDAINMGPDFSIDNFMVLATQVSKRAPRTSSGARPRGKFPNLKFAFSEGGTAGPVPHGPDRRHYQNQRHTGQDFGDKLPSEVFREHSLACFISDPTSLKLYKEIGIDIIAFETDYPHSDSLWPDAPELLLEQCDGAGMSDDDIDKVSWENVTRFCGYDPFA
jgi:hypothetical protein